MAETFSRYDSVSALDSDEAIAVFVADAFETGDASYIANALGIVARAKGMSAITLETGLSREQLNRSLGKSGKLSLKTTLAVVKALGLDLAATVRAN